MIAPKENGLKKVSWKGSGRSVNRQWVLNSRFLSSSTNHLFNSAASDAVSATSVNVKGGVNLLSTSNHKISWLPRVRRQENLQITGQYKEDTSWQWGLTMTLWEKKTHYKNCPELHPNVCKLLGCSTVERLVAIANLVHKLKKRQLAIFFITWFTKIISGPTLLRYRTPLLMKHSKTDDQW